MKILKIKKLTLFVVLLLFITSFGINAQSVDSQSIKPRDGKVLFDDDLRSCLVVSLDPEPKTLKLAWKEYLKDNYNLKLKGIGWLKNKDVLYAENIIIDKISASSMNFYTQILENENGSEMKLFVSYGYDNFLDKEKNADEYTSLNEILESFLKVYLPKYYTVEVNDTKKRLTDLTSEINKLNKDIISDSAKMADLKLRIEELTKKTETNITNLEINRKKLITREAKLKRIKNQLNNL